MCYPSRIGNGFLINNDSIFHFIDDSYVIYCWSNLNALHLVDLVIDGLEQVDIGGGMLQIGCNHLLCFYLEPFEFSALGEVLLLSIIIYGVINLFVSILNLNEIWLYEPAVWYGSSTLSDGLQLLSVLFPIVIFQLTHEFVTLFIMDLGRIKVLSHEAGD